MITPTGYSKDPHLQADGIVLTLPVMFFEDRKTNVQDFKKMFPLHMAAEDSLWNFRLTNLPTQDIAWVYLIFDKHIQFRCNFVQYERNASKRFADAEDGRIRSFPNANWVIMCGPAIPTPPGHHWYENECRGFQGFRYCTYLF